MEESIWAKLETKTRRLVFELLEPSINRVAEHKETLENLRRSDESLLRKIENLDILTDKLTKRLSVVDDFSRKILQFDATIHVQETTFAQDREAIRDELTTFMKQLNGAEENIANLLGQSQSLRTDLVNLAFESNNSKNLISSRIEEVREESLNYIYQQDSKHSDLSNYASALDKKFNLFLQDFSIIDIVARKAEHSAEDNMSQLKIIFKNFATYKKESKESIEKVRQMTMQFSQTLTEQMKSFREKFRFETPIQTQLIVSENLHAVLELKEKKLLAELEKEKLAEWEILISNNSFEDKIRLARQRTQEVIDKPLPRVERIMPLVVKEEKEKERERESLESPRARRQLSKIRREDEEGLNADVRKSGDSRVRRSKLDLKRELEAGDRLKADEESGRAGGQDERIESNAEGLTKDQEVPEAGIEAGKVGDDESGKSGKNGDSDSEESLSSEAKNPAEGETSNDKARVVEVSRPFDLNDIKKNASAIMSMLGIHDISEELSLLNDGIKRIQDDISAQVKRLQSADSSTDEKVQMILKKQYEISQRIEDLKTLQQNHATRAEADKKQLEEADSKTLERILKESLEINNKFSDLSKRFSTVERETQGRVALLTDNFEKLSKMTEKSLNSQERTLQVFYDDISKTNQILNLQIQQAALECNSAVTQRKRDHHDNQGEFRKIQGIFENFSKKYEIVNKNIENFSKTVTLLIEFSKIVHALMQQDEVDRESIALFGVKDSKPSLKGKTPVSVDKQCITCSGQPNFITSAFKLACLAYSPTSVLFKDTVYERVEMIEILKRIVDGISDEALADFVPLSDLPRQNASMKPGHFRPHSRQSNMSFSQSIASATPDLPPLSFQKRLNN